MTDQIRTPSPSRQIAFHQLLVAARKTWLMDALSETLGNVDPNELKTQLMTYVPADVQQILAVARVVLQEPPEPFATPQTHGR